MNRRPVRWRLLAVWLLLSACGHTAALAEKNAQSDELRKATTTGVRLPPGCPTLTGSVPAGQKDVTITYQEPTTDQKGRPLTDLSYTTIYLTAPNSQTQAIRVRAKDPKGGDHITISH